METPELDKLEAQNKKLEQRLEAVLFQLVQSEAVAEERLKTIKELEQKLTQKSVFEQIFGK